MPQREVCLITGASRGIGAALARRLASGGRTVFANYRASESDAVKLRETPLDSGSIELVQADVTDRAQVSAMMDRVARACGALHVFVHNAAPPLAPRRVKDLDWDADVLPAIRVACLGFLNCVQAAAPILVPGSRVVVMLSDALFHTPPTQMGAYLAAKGALWGLARSVAKELHARGVRVNTVSPGMTQTTLWQAYSERAIEIMAAMDARGRPADPDEVAAVIESIICDAAFPHDTNVFVNGGSIG